MAVRGSDDADSDAFAFEVRTLTDELRWGEGPALSAHYGGVVFSDIPANRLLIWEEGGGIRTFDANANFANGNTIDREGRLVSCEHGTRRVVRRELSGETTVLAAHYRGEPLNSPNDAIVASDGAVWFTDPPYGILQGHCGPDARVRQPVAGVYRFDPRTDEPELVIGYLDKPNGLALSPEERTLFVSDSGFSERPDGNRHIFKFDLDGWRPGPVTVFQEISPPGSDGMRFDAAGNLWSTAGDGIRCYAADGTRVAQCLLGEATTNLCLLPVSSDACRVFVTTPTRALLVGFPRRPAEPGLGAPLMAPAES